MTAVVGSYSAILKSRRAGRVAEVMMTGLIEVAAVRGGPHVSMVVHAD